MKKDFLQLLFSNKVLPIGIFDNPDYSVRTAELLLSCSISIMEITVRTKSAYECIEAIRKKVPEMFIGSGSVLSINTLQNAHDSGAQFAVAPGFDPEIVDYAASLNLPFIPGAATPTELTAALKKSQTVKIFPASSLGGVEYLKAITAPFVLENFYLVPTGGVGEKNYIEYLKLDKVAACGMSYIVDKALIESEDFETLEKRIKGIVAGLHEHSLRLAKGF